MVVGAFGLLGVAGCQMAPKYPRGQMPPQMMEQYNQQMNAPKPARTGMGGAPRGGAPMGGAPMGGAPMGGAPMGGAPMGGAPMGGAPR